MYPQGRHPAPHQPGQPGFKFTVAESCDRIKDEFQFLQAQYHSLKVEYDKLANEKTEMQRHYVMYYEMSYGLNIEMHKQIIPTSFSRLLLPGQKRPGEAALPAGSLGGCAEPGSPVPGVRGAGVRLGEASGTLFPRRSRESS